MEKLVWKTFTKGALLTILIPADDFHVFRVQIQSFCSLITAKSIGFVGGCILSAYYCIYCQTFSCAEQFCVSKRGQYTCTSYMKLLLHKGYAEWNPMKNTQWQCLAYHITSFATCSLQCHTLAGRQSTVNHPPPTKVADIELLAYCGACALEITAVDLWGVSCALWRWFLTPIVL